MDWNHKAAYPFNTQEIPMKWNISDKVKLIFVIIVFFLFFIGVFAYLNIKRLETNTDWVDHVHKIIHSLQKMYADLKDSQTNYADFLLTGNKNFSKACETDIDNIERELNRANGLVSEDVLWRQNMEDLQSQVGKRLTSMREGLAYARAGRSDLAIGRVKSEVDKQSNREIKDLVNRMSGFQIWLLKTRKDFEDTNTHKGVQFVGWSSFTAFLLCVLAAYFIIRQINDRQTALNQLRASEEKYRFLAENANEGFVTVDQDGKIVDLNPSSEIMFGYSKTELLGQNLVLLMPRRFLDEHGAKAFARFLEITNPKAGVTAMDLYARKKDGIEFPVEVSVSAWETKEGTFYTTINRDITERKFFMKTLLKNEHRLFQFLEAIPVGIMVRDKTGMPYYANQAAKNLLGRDILKDETSLTKNSQVYPAYLAGTEDPYPTEKLPITKAMAGEKSFVDDMEIRHPGKTIPVHAWGAPIIDENNMVKFGLLALIDMTHQREITESLKSREEFFRNLFEEGPIGMTLSFPDSTLVNVNRAFSNMLGYPKDQIIGRSFLDFTHPDDIPSEQMLSQKLFDKLIPKYESEKRYITKKGQPIWCKLSASVIRDLNDEPMFRLAIVENITDKREAETALKESEEKFRRVFAESPLGMSFIAQDGKIEDINKAFCEMLGYSREELINTNIYNLTHPEDIEKNKTISQTDLGKRVKNVEKRYLTKNKNAIWVSVTPLLMKEKDGKSFRVLSIAEDITERKQIDEMKNDLVSVVSHQLKTPVAEINGYIENMLEGLAGELSGKQKQYLLDMKDIGMENYRLISDLLSMSKIERGVITVDLVPVSLSQIVELAFRDYESLIHNKGLSLIIKNIPEDVQVLADRDKTVETLRNIINNAIKCTDQGSITVVVRTNASHALVEVVDSGIGMSEETLKKLFTKARVLGTEASRSGAGLGLYIAKHFMNLQNGDITAESKLGEGSVFSVKIPLTKERA